jgi:ABC-2 type transport system permease protein
MILSADMAYKWNFIIKMVAIFFMDLIGPIVILLIYSNTSGISGWSFEQFILFQGILIFVIGIGQTFFLRVGYEVVYMVQHGKFDTILIKPFRPLVQLTLTSLDWEFMPEIFVGLGLMSWAFVKLGLDFFTMNTVMFVVLVVLGLFVYFSLIVIVSSLSFLVVKSWGLFSLLWRTIDFVRYPLDIYSLPLRYLFTFFLPLGLASFYPAKALMGEVGWLFVGEMVLVVGAFFGLSLVLWHFAMKKYTSAGG